MQYIKVHISREAFEKLLEITEFLEDTLDVELDEDDVLSTIVMQVAL